MHHLVFTHQPVPVCVYVCVYVCVSGGGRCDQGLQPLDRGLNVLTRISGLAPNGEGEMGRAAGEKDGGESTLDTKCHVTHPAWACQSNLHFVWLVPGVRGPEEVKGAELRVTEGGGPPGGGDRPPNSAGAGPKGAGGPAEGRAGSRPGHMEPGQTARGRRRPAPLRAGVPGEAAGAEQEAGAGAAAGQGGGGPAGEGAAPADGGQAAAEDGGAAAAAQRGTAGRAPRGPG